ncbi:MAG: 4-hydroxybutyryl-CoA dehydratase [Actinobacteria bacterium]|nr:4-hydroxybutyryl-CoA dehydratase [Actinomycetota bacterium]
MGLRTLEEYVSSLQDDRAVYILGEKVEDVTTDPMLEIGVKTAGIDYRMGEMDDFRDLATVTTDSGEAISRYYYVPKDSEDLLKRHELMVTATRLGGGVIPFTKDVGSDAMNAVSIVANIMGKSEYLERAEEYRRHLQKNDLSVACAMTDVKGDRGKHPSSPEQAHPDYYVRVVDRDDKGIVVRGAKVHITAAPYCNEILVLPCRNLSQADADYAVSFAVDAGAEGVVQICHPMDRGPGALEFPVDMPWRMHTDSLIIFDDVFVPWERVFLCGEYDAALHLVYNFAYIHRHTAASYRIPMSEAMLGMAYAIAKYNGVLRYAHVRKKLVEIMIYVDTLKSMANASCINAVVHGGLPIPNPKLSNIAKYHFANNYHNCVKALQDIAGGIVVTGPTYKDYMNPEEKPYIDKYLGGTADVSTEDRLRMLQLIRRVFASDLGGYSEILALHAEGSLAAQELMVFGESLAEAEEYQKMAEMAAGIQVDTPPTLPEYEKVYKALREMRD